MAASPVITIDGPSASGKGTISQLLARRLGWHFLDSGMLYRLVGIVATEEGVPLDDGDALAGMIGRLPIRFESAEVPGGPPRVFVGDRSVGDSLRGEDAGRAASRVAVLPAVRESLLERQRAFRSPPGLVADGRDMGTVVFPDAPLKIFLEASVEERARRRYKQLREKGMDVTLSSISDELAARDRRDRGRGVAPLRPAADAVVLDTTTMTIDEVVAAVFDRWRRVAGAAGGHGI